MSDEHERPETEAGAEPRDSVPDKDGARRSGRRRSLRVPVIEESDGNGQLHDTLVGADIPAATPDATSGPKPAVVAQSVVVSRVVTISTPPPAITALAAPPSEPIDDEPELTVSEPVDLDMELGEDRAEVTLVEPRPVSPAITVHNTGAESAELILEEELSSLRLETGLDSDDDELPPPVRPKAVRPSVEPAPRPSFRASEPRPPPPPEVAGRGAALPEETTGELVVDEIIDGGGEAPLGGDKPGLRPPPPPRELKPPEVARRPKLDGEPAEAPAAEKRPRSAPPPPKDRPPAPPPATAAAPAKEAPAQAKETPRDKEELEARRAKKKAQWWEELFNDDYLRTAPPPHPRHIARQCDFLEARLGLRPGATILDVGCGLGLHAIELTRRGYLVVGLDLSLPMLSRAADEAQDEGFKINFLHADMREMNFEGAFDAVLCIGTTFGYFDDDVNRQVVERLYRALKPKGLLLLDVVNRDFVVRSQPNLVWFEGDGCVVMEETTMNFITARLAVKRTVILDDGRQRENHYTVRLYALHELGNMLHQRGFRVVEVSGRESTPGVFFGADSPRLIILAERRVQQAAPPSPPKRGGSEPGENGPTEGTEGAPEDGH